MLDSPCPAWSRLAVISGKVMPAQIVAGSMMSMLIPADDSRYQV
jgi:hypothetical protein